MQSPDGRLCRVFQNKDDIHAVVLQGPEAGAFRLSSRLHIRRDTRTRKAAVPPKRQSLFDRRTFRIALSSRRQCEYVHEFTLQTRSHSHAESDCVICAGIVIYVDKRLSIWSITSV